VGVSMFGCGCAQLSSLSISAEPLRWQLCGIADVGLSRVHRRCTVLWPNISLCMV
jgi:hypothetical protein